MAFTATEQLLGSGVVSRSGGLLLKELFRAAQDGNCLIPCRLDAAEAQCIRQRQFTFRPIEFGPVVRRISGG